MTPEERNVETFCRLMAADDAGDLDAALACYAPGYVDHDAGEARRHGPSDLDGARRAFRAFLAALPDTRHTVRDLLAQGDRLAARIVIYRFEDGRIAERWCRGDRTVL